MATGEVPDAEPHNRCCVVVPTYNEAEGITLFLNRLLAATGSSGPIDVLVVDDSSPDGTADLVRAHPEYQGRVRLLLRTSKDGLGAAYRAGFSWAIDAGYDVIVQMDADHSHPVEQVKPMIERLRQVDVVLGSRYVPGGATRGWPWSRRALSWAANFYARSVLGLRTRDVTSGFRAWRTAAVNTAGVLETTSNGYGFQVENTWHAERAGLRVHEHPIVFTDRSAGTSKMTSDVAREAFVAIARWRTAELTGAHRPTMAAAAEPHQLMSR